MKILNHLKMSDKSKYNKSSTKKEVAIHTFEEAMRKIVNTPKEKVEEAIEAEKKKPRGKSVKNR